MKVLFIEIEIPRKNEDIASWFPRLEERIQRRLPKYNALEGGVYRDKEGNMHGWAGAHYYMCIPSDPVSMSALSELTPYATVISSREKEIDDSLVNENHDIFYWGPGCDPALVPIRVWKSNREYEEEEKKI